jgi:hypothetical protein
MRHTMLVIALAGTLGACGYSTTDRAVSGGLLGAGTGAVAGSLMGSAATGALVGGALGAGAGALTSPSSVNLGKPAWR